MKLYLMRHGRTNCNDKKIRDDNPKTRVRLNQLGKIQANAAAKKLKKINFEVIYCSELLRCRQTAKIINKFHEKKIILDKRLDEHNTGFDKKSHILFLEARSRSKDIFNYRPKIKGAESQKNVFDRIKNFIKELENKDHKEILIVSHGCIIEFFYKIKTGKEYCIVEGKKGMENCDVIELFI